MFIRRAWQPFDRLSAHIYIHTYIHVFLETDIYYIIRHTTGLGRLQTTIRIVISWICLQFVVTECTTKWAEEFRNAVCTGGKGEKTKRVTKKKKKTFIKTNILYRMCEEDLTGCK